MKNYSTLDEFLKADDRNRNRFDIKSLQGYSANSNSNKIWATLLSQLEPLYVLLRYARIDIGIEPIYGVRHIIIEEYRITSETIETIKPPLYPEGIKRLHKHSTDIVNELHLTPNWWIPIKMLILIHTLYLPQANKQVTFSKTQARAVPFYINEQISIAELQSQISKLSLGLSSLPKAPSSKIERDTIRWGRAVQLVGGGVGAIFSDNWIVKARDELETLIVDEIVPPPEDLSRYYKRYLQYQIKQLRPPVLFAKFPVKPADQS